VDPARQARADMVAQAQLDGVYGQHWKAETVHSVIKRKFGDTVRSRALRRQSGEPIVRLKCRLPKSDGLPRKTKMGTNFSDK